jgi:hypothetical protein
MSSILLSSAFTEMSLSPGASASAAFTTIGAQPITAASSHPRAQRHILLKTAISMNMLSIPFPDPDIDQSLTLSTSSDRCGPA